MGLGIRVEGFWPLPNLPSEANYLQGSKARQSSQGVHVGIWSSIYLGLRAVPIYLPEGLKTQVR